jgi:hypothetical protein
MIVDLNAGSKQILKKKHKIVTRAAVPGTQSGSPFAEPRLKTG